MSSSVDMSGVPQLQVPNSASLTASLTPPNASERESMGISVEHTSTRFIWFVSALQCLVSFQNSYNTTIVSGAMGPLSDHYRGPMVLLAIVHIALAGFLIHTESPCITGINAVLYYLKTFLEQAGMESMMANYKSIRIRGIIVVMMVVSIVLIDRAGRKPLLLVSLVGMTVLLMCISVFCHVHTLSRASAGVGSIFFTILFVVFFAMGLGPVPWCLVPELFPSATRALAVSASLFTNWVTNLAVSLAFLPLIDATSMSAVFWGFAILSALSLAFVLFVLPETKGHTIEDIVSSMRK
eukprot:m51a1_g13245 hypothetical protein (296) ;mRNA; r:1404-2597